MSAGDRFHFRCERSHGVPARRAAIDRELVQILPHMIGEGIARFEVENNLMRPMFAVLSQQAYLASKLMASYLCGGLLEGGQINTSTPDRIMGLTIMCDPSQTDALRIVGRPDDHALRGARVIRARTVYDNEFKWVAEPSL